MSDNLPLSDTKVPLGGSGDLTKDGILDILSQEDEVVEEKEPEKEDEEKEEKKEEVEEDKEEKEEVKLADEEEEPLDDELVVPSRKKDILKDFPELFKKHPYLEKAIYRDQQFTELLGNPADAKEVIDKAETLDKFESQIMKGEIGDVLTAAKENDSKSFNKIVDNYLPALFKVDNNAYFHVIGNVIKHTIFNMSKEAQSSKNEALQEAAHILNQFIFGTSEFQKVEKLSKDTDVSDEAKNELQQERALFYKETFESKRDDLNSKLNNILKATVSEHIDKKNAMTDYVKKNAIRDVLDDLDVRIHQDSGFQKVIDDLWKKAFSSRFSETSMRTIRATYLSKAKTLLPSIIQKAKNDALRGLGKRMKDDSEEEVDRKGPITARQSAPEKSGKKSEIPKGMSSRDFIMQD